MNLTKSSKNPVTWNHYRLPTKVGNIRLATYLPPYMAQAPLEWHLLLAERCARFRCGKPSATEPSTISNKPKFSSFNDIAPDGGCCQSKNGKSRFGEKRLHVYSIDDLFLIDCVKKDIRLHIHGLCHSSKQYLMSIYVYCKYLYLYKLFP